LAAEFNAKGDAENLKRLFRDTTKYLNIVSFPIFVYILFFADKIIMAWMGAGFEMSAYLLRILAAAQLINMTFSAPGNSITPNIGIPKYQMYEGLINLGLNLVLSYFFIKYYGIIGAAIGNSISIAISSLYVFYVSSVHFKERIGYLFKDYYKKPLVGSLVTCLVLFLISHFIERNFYSVTGRLSALVYVIPNVLIFSLIYTLHIFNGSYLNANDRIIFIKILMKLLPVKQIINRRRNKITARTGKDKYYNNELVSLFIITYNRLEMLKKCISSLLPTLQNVNCEVIIWDNNSTDGTKEFLSGITDRRMKVVLNENNIGTNAKGKSAELCKGEYLIGIDDDVIDFPANWVEDIIYAYKNIPYIGYLASNVVQDEFTNGARPGDEQYTTELYDNGNIEFFNGPTGGWCFLISRKIYDKVGKFADIKNRIFFSEDGDYLNRLINKGYRFGLNKKVKVYHASGLNFNTGFQDVFENKMKDYKDNKVPLMYHLKIMYQNKFSLKRLYYRLLKAAEKHIDSGE
jgi:GT2 family glycosyltransferase